MDFWSAVGLLKQGIHVNRSTWEDPNEYLFMEHDIFMKHKDGKEFPIIFFSYEILATDWEVVRQRATPEGS
jgi:hypothetical protein